MIASIYLQVSFSSSLSVASHYESIPKAIYVDWVVFCCFFFSAVKNGEYFV